jgi:hypothetical protein
MNREALSAIADLIGVLLVIVSQRSATGREQILLT